MFIITCRCTKKWQGNFQKGKQTLGIRLDAHQLGVSQPGCSYCDGNVKSGARSHMKTKLHSAVDKMWKLRCQILIEREPKNH